MFHKIVWFYFSALILLEFSFQSKLSAHEHIDDVTHNSLASDGLAIQECAGCEAAGAAGAEGVRLWPAALALGRVSLGTARAARVTLHNRADSTLHLASVAGTTPDFHASFFHSKSIPRGGNTSFSVVFVARGEGPAAADLFLHTSRGLHKYPVEAWGAASAWCVRPAGGLRVAHNVSTLAPLHVCNPTDQPLQIVEAFSSAAWCGVEVGPEWTLGPHSEPPSPPLTLNLRHHHDPHTAYLRVKFNDSAVGSLTVRVDVTATRGLTLPSHVDLGTRGSADEPHIEVLRGANPSGVSVRMEPRACAPLCGPDTAHPHPHHLGVTEDGCGDDTANGAGPGTAHGGVWLRALADSVAPHAAYRPLAELHFNWTELWAVALASGGDPGSIMRCSGQVRLAAQSVHYSVRILSGTFSTRPVHAHFVSGACGGAAEGGGAGEGQLLATSTFSLPLHVINVVYPHDAHLYFTMGVFAAEVVAAGAAWRGPVVRARASACGRAYSARLHVLTNVTRYSVPLALYTPALHWEFDWIGYSEGVLEVGGVPAGRVRRIEGFLATAAPADHLILDVTTDPPDVKLLFQQQELVVPARSRVPVTLEIPSPAHAGVVFGVVTVHTRHVTLTLKLTYSRVDGDLRLHDITLQGSFGAVALTADSSLRAPLELRGLALSGDLPYSLHYTTTCQSASGELQTVTSPVPTSRAGTGAVAAPCLAMAPLTLSYLHHSALDGASECADEPEAALERDAARLWARAAAPGHQHNFTLHMYTGQLLQVSASGRATPDWTYLASPLSDLGGAVIGQAVSSSVRVSNPSAAWPLWLQPVLAPYRPLPDVAFGSALPPAEARSATPADCGAFSLEVSGGLPAPCAGAVLVPPGGTVHVNVTFVPDRVGDYHAVLYLRNNVSVLEAAWARARGERARVSVRGAAGLRARTGCRVAARGEVVVRNEARAVLSGGSALLAGVPCAARGFSVTPCPHPPLQPDQVLVLTVEYAGEWSVATARVTLQVPHGAPLALWARVGAAQAARCSAAPAPAPRAAPPRAPALLLAVLAAAAALTAAACHAEAVLKRAVASMRTRDPPQPLDPHHPPPHLLDLRALARTTLHAHIHTANATNTALLQQRADTQQAAAAAPLQSPRADVAHANAHSAAHALTATASSLARHKRKVKKILAEIKSDLAKSRPLLRKSPDYSDDFDSQLIEDDLSRSSNEESIDTNADESNDKNDFCDKFDSTREKFDDFDSQCKYDRYATPHDKPEQSSKYSTHHYKDKTEASRYKPSSPSERSDKYENRGDKSRYDKVAETCHYGEASAPPPAPAPRDDDSSTESSSDRDQPLADTPPPHHKREGVCASEIASSANGASRRRERVSKRDSNTPPRPHERNRHVRPKARVVARRRSPPAPPAERPATPATPAAPAAPATPTTPAGPPAPPALRATFSEIVSSGAPTPPRAAPVTPPAPPTPRDDTHDSLFYYSATRGSGSTWGGSSPLTPGAPLSSLTPGAPLSSLAPLTPPAPVAPPAPQALRSDIFTHAQDRHSAYNDTGAVAGVSGVSGVAEGVGAGAGAGAGAWWGAGWRAVRPPPGFAAAPRAPPAAPPAAHAEAARTFDPLNALAGVWEGGAWPDARAHRH